MTSFKEAFGNGDVARIIGSIVIEAGDTEVWYQKPPKKDATYIPFGFEVPDLIAPGNLEETHILLGKVKETDLEKIFMMLQGENYSPIGEANHFIKSKGLRHTSMSVGDAIKVDGKVYAVDSCGFKKLYPCDDCNGTGRTMIAVRGEMEMDVCHNLECSNGQLTYEGWEQQEQRNRKQDEFDAL